MRDTTINDESAAIRFGGDCIRRLKPGGVSFVAVSKPLVISHAARKRGNPNWGKPMEAAPDVPTAFEAEVQRLGLNEQTCATSEKLKQWCERNKDRCYIPESLLKRWGIQVDPNVSG